MDLTQLKVEWLDFAKRLYPIGTGIFGGTTLKVREVNGCSRLATVTDNASLDELLVKIKDELRKLGPLIDLEVAREPQGSRTEGGVTAESRTIEHGWRSGA
jgi:hypothetical protein